MAVMDLLKQMVFWDISVEGSNTWIKIMQDCVASMTITYEVGALPKAVIHLISVSYIEDVFTVGRKVKIGIGFDPIWLVHMIEGTVMKEPNGDATDKMSYSVEIAGLPPKMINTAQNRIMPVPDKMTIISQIAAENGMIPDVLIEDISLFDKYSLPMQMNKTPYEFLIECANRWECVFWFSQNEITGVHTLHFYDAKNAYAYGNLIKKTHVNDMFPHYQLGYRTDFVPNNVAKVSWKFKPRRGGSPGAISFSEFGKKENADDWVISFRGQRWELRPEFIKQATKRPDYWKEYLKVTILNGVGNVEATVRKYFRQVPSGSKNQQDSYQNEILDLNIDLNVGDPYLRPPRTALLYSGSLNPKAVSAYLPLFLYEGDNQMSALFRMKKVETSLSAGKLNTSIELSRRIDGTL